MRARFSLSIALTAGLVACQAPAESTPPAPLEVAAVPAAAPVAARTDSPWEYLRARYDANADGLVTPDEYERAGGHFERLDRNGDGRLDATDFEGGDEMRAQMEGFRAQMLLASYFQDDDDATSLSLDELVLGAAAYDANGDEVVSADEFAARASSRKRDLPMGGMGRMMMDGDPFAGLTAAADADADGALSMEELIAFFRARDDGDEVWTFREPRRERTAAATEPQSGPRTGTLAPDFTLSSPDGDQTVTLSDFRGHKPVALIFGSYT